MATKLPDNEVIRDRNGDVWIRYGNETVFWCLTSTEARGTLDEIQDAFGPVQRAEWSAIEAPPMPTEA